MLYGEGDHEGTKILNTSPLNRHYPLWRVEGMTEDGGEVEAYTWDDHEGDAIDSVLDWLDMEGTDDSGLTVRRVKGGEKAAVAASSDRWHEDECLRVLGHV